ncbi:MAG: TraB/GumN family protein [Ferruginibacter sp.]|nr:TraB/GumN family protein [Ferruginibacter sp.]
MSRLLLFFLSISILQSCKAQQPPLSQNADDNTLLWEVSGNNIKKPSYIFGTFHMLCKDDIHFSENLNKAIAQAEEVYFEIDLDDVSSTLGVMLLMNMKDGKTLKDLYTPEEFDKVKAYFEDSLKMPMAVVKRMKPMFLQAMLYPKLMPCNKASGVEEELMVIAKKNKKEIKGLETIAEQAAVFDSIPYDVQAKELLKGIDSLSFYSNEFVQMVETYKAQQLKKIGEMFSQSEFNMDEQQQEFLLNRRNRNWVQQLKSIMADKNVFVAVGAGHLPGKNGLIELLRDAGYTLRPIANK